MWYAHAAYNICVDLLQDRILSKIIIKSLIDCVHNAAKMAQGYLPTHFVLSFVYNNTDESPLLRQAIVDTYIARCDRSTCAEEVTTKLSAFILKVARRLIRGADDYFRGCPSQKHQTIR